MWRAAMAAWYHGACIWQACVGERRHRRRYNYNARAPSRMRAAHRAHITARFINIGAAQRRGSA